jgi:hypothetical protein
LEEERKEWEKQKEREREREREFCCVASKQDREIYNTGK